LNENKIENVILVQSQFFQWHRETRGDNSRNFRTILSHSATA